MDWKRRSLGRIKLQLEHVEETLGKVSLDVCGVLAIGKDVQ